MHDSHVDYKSVGVIMRRDAARRVPDIPRSRKTVISTKPKEETSTPAYTRSHARRCVSPRLPSRSCLCFGPFMLRFLPFSISRYLPYSVSPIPFFFFIVIKQRLERKTILDLFEIEYEEIALIASIAGAVIHLFGKSRKHNYKLIMLHYFFNFNIQFPEFLKKSLEYCI